MRRLAQGAVTQSIRLLLRVVCRIHSEELRRLPHTGPLIVVANHINSLEVPIIYTHIQPRPATAFVKAETWDNPLLAPLARLWGAIPLHRGEADTEAFRQALVALGQDRIVMVAPEGTRSRHGRLQRGRPGVVLLALRSQAPLLPMAHWGGETYQADLRRLRRPSFHIAVGEPFALVPGARRVDSARRQQLVDAIMYRIADLLPQRYRGAYAGDVGELATLTAPVELGGPDPRP